MRVISILTEFFDKIGALRKNSYNQVIEVYIHIKIYKRKIQIYFYIF